jgi:hypothetical protein
VLRIHQHLEDGARQAQFTLARLVGIGIDAYRDRGAAVGARGQFAHKLGGGIRLVEQPGFEIEAGREPEPGMCGPREAIGAAVLATAVGIDGTVEADIGRIVVRDHRAAGIDTERGHRRRQRLLEAAPAVVDLLAGRICEAVDRAQRGAATLADMTGKFAAHDGENCRSSPPAGSSPDTTPASRPVPPSPTSGRYRQASE